MSRYATMRFDGDSFLVTADAEGNSRQTVTQTAVGFMQWDDYLARVRRAHGQHAVEITGPGAAVMVIRDAGRYVGHHRRHSGERLLRPREWECVLLTHHEDVGGVPGRVPLWWRTGDLHHLPPFPGTHRHVNDGAPWQPTITTSRTESHQ
jgi:hypothetical protein